LSIVDFLSELKQADIRLALNNGKLKVNAPTGALTNEIKVALKSRKQEIIEFLTTTEKSVASVIQVVSRDQLLPLSFAQQRLWYLAQLDPMSVAYNMPIAIRLKGQLELKIFQLVIEEVVRRHESLRTTFNISADGEPHQVIQDAGHWIIDIETAEQEEAVIDVKALANEEARKVFDIEHGPLFRVRLVALRSDDYLMLASMHHIISDGWSINVLIREIGVLYAAFLKGAPSPLPELVFQYVDYASWQRKHLQGERLGAQLKYWTDLLAGAPNVIGLPTDRPRPAVQTDNGARLPIVFSVELTNRIEMFARSQELTLFMVLMASYQILLSRYAKENDICVGIPVAGRSNQDTEGLIGFFVNALITRIDLSGNPTVSEFLGRVKALVLDVFAHDEVPLNMILDELEVERSLSYSPFVQVGFQVQSFDSSATQADEERKMSAELKRLTNLEMEMVRTDKIPSKYDLILSLNKVNVDGGSKLVGYLDYNTDLYDLETVSSMMSQFQCLVAEIIVDTNQPVQNLKLVSDGALYSALAIDPNLERIRPVAANQRALVLDSLLHPKTIQNSVGYYVEIFHQLDVTAMGKAAQAVGDHNEILRSRFVTCDLPYADDLYQVVAVAKKLQINVIDLRSKNVKPNEYIRSVIYQPYDVINDDLVTFTIAQFGEKHFAVVIAAHHSVMDGVSMYAHLDYLLECYKNDCTQISTSKQYSDYVEYDRAVMDRRTVLDYWKMKFLDVEPLGFSIPADKVEYPQQSKDQIANILQSLPMFEVREQLEIDDGHADAIRLFCKANDCSLSNYFKVLYGVLIRSYCRPDNDFHIVKLIFSFSTSLSNS